jgi:pimeloyl-ACP methyl ester carboxylesterase
MPYTLYPILVFVEIDGLRTNVERAGEGPPVLLLHGWGNSARTLAPVMRALASSHSVWALDLPGFGLSLQPRETWGIEQYAGFVRHAMARLGIERADLFGHSRGGAIAVAIAAETPELVNRLVLAGSAGIRTPRTLRFRLRGLTARTGRRVLGHRLVGRAGQRLLSALYCRLGMSDYRDAGPMRAIFVKLVNQDVAPLLPRVQAPALLLWGARDQETPLWMGRQMAQTIPHAELVVFANAGHHAFLDEPAAFNQAVGRFLAAAPLPVP